jgi:hypothetical protein
LGVGTINVEGPSARNLGLVELDDRTHVAWPGVLTIRSKTGSWPVPPFGDLSAHGEGPALGLDETTLIAVELRDYFGGVLNYWMGAKLDSVTCAGVGEPPRPADVELSFPYVEFLRGRFGEQSWRDALTGTDAKVQGSAPSIIHAASVAMALPALPALQAEVTLWVVRAFDQAIRQPPDTIDEVRDPATEWPWLEPWTGIELIHLEVANAAALDVVRALRSDGPAQEWVRINSVADLDHLGRPELPASVVKFGLDDLEVEWRGTLGELLARERRQ